MGWVCGGSRCHPGLLVDVVEALAAFLLPHAAKARNLHAKRMIDD
jgi:hypothetical protein